MAETIDVVETLEKLTCGKCGMTFGVPVRWVAERRDDHEQWYCPNGHPRVFNGKSDAEKLRDELARLKHEKDQTEARLVTSRSYASSLEKSVSTIKGQLTKVKNRVAKGVCPCCNRSFANLHRHMTTEHPDFTTPAASA